MELVTWVIYGLIVGVIAKLIMPGRDPGGCILTSLLGVSGAILGGYIGRRYLGVAHSSIIGNLILAVFGAMLILAAYRFLFNRRT
jgi:uncharacterized membrane protein YeaQ/YmgE (transglycosylase-associated protein family)